MLFMSVYSENSDKNFEKRLSSQKSVEKVFFANFGWSRSHKLLPTFLL